MKRCLFTVIITLIAIYINWSEFLMGNRATVMNLITSTVFMLLWLIYSFYWGVKQEKTYKKFILVYWGINILSFLMILIVSQSEFSSLFLLPFSIWYGGPVYGFSYLLKSNISMLIIITAPLGLMVSYLGFWIGVAVSSTLLTVGRSSK